MPKGACVVGINLFHKDSHTNSKNYYNKTLDWKNQGWKWSGLRNDQGWNFLPSLVSHHRDAKWSLFLKYFSKTNLRNKGWQLIGLKIIRVEKLSGLKFPACSSVLPSWCEMVLVLLASNCFSNILIVSQIFFNHQTKNQGWRLSRWKNYQGWNFLLSLVSRHHDAKWSSCCWHQLISQIFSKH